MYVSPRRRCFCVQYSNMIQQNHVISVFSRKTAFVLGFQIFEKMLSNNMGQHITHSLYSATYIASWIHALHKQHTQ